MKRSKSAFVLFMVLIAGSLLTSCHFRTIGGDGNVVTKEIAVSDYQELLVEGGNIELVYTQSNAAPFLQIETDQNILDLLETEVSGDELSIRPKDHQTSINPTCFKIKTNSKQLKDLKIGGQGEGVISGTLTSDELDLSFAGSGILTADSLIVNNLECDIAGSGKLVLGGKAENTKIKAAGSCEVRAFGLTTEKLDCKAAGSNDIEITVNQEINSKMAGSGNLKYKGNPAQVHNNSVGSVSVTHVE